MALTKVTNSMINGAAINVLDYGADPTGVADSTAAFNAAAAALTQTNDNFTKVVNGVTCSFNVGSCGELIIPKGNYKVSSEISIPSYSRVIGQHATITGTDSTKYIFNVYGFETHIEGISFAQGKSAIYYRQGNVDTCINSITNCEFNGQYDYSIVSTGTYSTKLNISNCKFIVYAGALFNECDECTFETSWITALGPDIVYIKNHGNLTARDLALIPDTSGTSAQQLTTYWFQNGNASTYAGGYTYLLRVRFGGESGGFSAAINYAAAAGPSQINRGFIFDSCGLWGNSIIRLAQMPDFVITTNTDVQVGGLAQLINDVDLTTLTSSPYISLDFVDTLEDNAILSRPISTTYGTSEQNLLNTNSYFSGATGFSNLGTGGSGTNTSELPLFGYLNQLTFGSDNGSQLYATYSYSGLSLSAGWYTTSVVIKATKDITLSFGIQGLGANKRTHIPGDNNYHLVSWQFFNPGGNLDLGFALYNVRTDGVVVTWGDPKLVSGYISTPSASYHGGSVNTSVININGTLYADSIPTTGSWSKGAMVFNKAATSGGYIGWVCTAAGSPGTWKTFGLIS